MNGEITKRSFLQLDGQKEDNPFWGRSWLQAVKVLFREEERCRDNPCHSDGWFGESQGQTTSPKHRQISITPTQRESSSLASGRRGGKPACCWNTCWDRWTLPTDLSVLVEILEASVYNLSERVSMSFAGIRRREEEKEAEDALLRSSTCRNTTEDSRHLRETVRSLLNEEHHHLERRWGVKWWKLKGELVLKFELSRTRLMS